MNSAPARDASNDTPEPIAWAVYGGRTGTLRYVEQDADHVRMLVEDGGYVARPLYEHPAPTPPADDVREALIEALADEQNWIYNGTHAVFNEGYGADAILADPSIEVRPRGTVTDAEVEAALDVFAGFFFTPSATTMRAALEAARKARS